MTAAVACIVFVAAYVLIATERIPMSGCPARCRPMAGAVEVQMRGRWPWEAESRLEILARRVYPTLLVSGGHSAMFDAVCDVLERRLSARRIVLKGAGHSIPTLGRPVNDCLTALWRSVP
jgi:hypothetical protein